MLHNSNILVNGRESSRGQKALAEQEVLIFAATGRKCKQGTMTQGGEKLEW